MLRSSAIRTVIDGRFVIVPDLTGIRPAQPDDDSAIARLMLQLGYEVPSAQVRERLETLSLLRRVFVALAEGNVAGWIAISIQSAFVTGRDALIEGFVVDEVLRGRGVGSSLLETASDWAKGCGCKAIGVSSNITRDAAHRFYERNGFERVKIQHHFIKHI